MNQVQALKILQTGVNVFLTGEPGSGKTHTVNKYIAYLRSHGVEAAITASTGIAATHIGGTTIHSWSGIGIKEKLDKNDLRAIVSNSRIKKKVNSAKVLIIDEISMLSPGTLQSIDAVCRMIKNDPRPFGGVQVVLVGDFFQLPPVVSQSKVYETQDDLFHEEPVRFAYGSAVWEDAEFVTCYITEQYRQSDESLLGILSKIRKDNFDLLSLDLIKGRKADIKNFPPNAPKLYSHNLDVDSMNDQMLAKIPGEAKFYPMNSKGHAKLIAAMKKGCLSPENLFLKTGASVMFTKNNPKEGYANGTLGEVEGFSAETDLPIVRTKNGRKVEVAPAEWMVEEEGTVKGWLLQLPLRLAWAMTVHKSQGVSLDEAIMDLSRVFEFGQGYVALSRVRSLQGLHILGWNEVAFKVDPEVLEKDKYFRDSSIQAEKVFSRFSDQKLIKMYDDFITNSDGTIDARAIKPKTDEKISTYELTLRFWKEGKNISQIAKDRNLSENTILSHIEKLNINNKIEYSQLAKIVPKHLKADLPSIHAVFKKMNTDKLSPAFEHFKGRYSYYDLKIAKMTMDRTK